MIALKSVRTPSDNENYAPRYCVTSVDAIQDIETCSAFAGLCFQVGGVVIGQ